MFGAGGGTSSYREAEDTNLIILWGSNARETHPIFFHHLLRGVRNGARLVAVDPRRTSSAQWADVWLGIDVGSDIALANAMARVIIHAGLANREFIARATTGYEEFARCVEPYTLELAEKETGVPAYAIRDVALEYGRADQAMICWTLGITEHHNATDNVLALINLALLTGKVGRYGCGLNPLRGQNNVQGGGDMGAIPARMPGFQDLQDPAIHDKFSRAWGGAQFPDRKGYHLSEMFEAMEHGELTSAYIVGENPARSEADQTRAVRLLSGLEHLVVQDIFLTQTAELAGGNRRRSRCGTNAAASRRCTPACHMRGSTSLAAYSGHAPTSRIRGPSSCTRVCGRTRSKEFRRRFLSWSTIHRWIASPRSFRSGSRPAAALTPSTPECRPVATRLLCARARRC